MFSAKSNSVYGVRQLETPTQESIIPPVANKQRVYGSAIKKRIDLSSISKSMSMSFSEAKKSEFKPHSQSLLETPGTKIEVRASIDSERIRTDRQVSKVDSERGGRLSGRAFA